MKIDSQKAYKKGQNEMSKVKYGEMGPCASRCGAPFVLAFRML